VPQRKALITGITGQDGSYLAELLLERGYEVHGTVRQIALQDPAHHLARIASIQDRLTLHGASLESYPSLFSVFAAHSFDECYHLAAQSFAAETLRDGFSTMNANINGTHYILAAIREAQPSCKVYFAGSSEMFGKANASPQNEETPFHPRNPYGISKVTGFNLCRTYRETHDMFCVCGILFNHESPRRGHEFVTRKITSKAAAIKLGLAKELRLGNLDARRDWGHAFDYVRAMHAMMEREQPDDYVVATGETHTVRDLAEIAFSHVGLNYADYVVTDERFYRPAEKNPLVGDASKARRDLGWEPTYSFEQLVREMVDADLKELGARCSK
jgi:GDPmannose 4,6-dehydratase